MESSFDIRTLDGKTIESPEQWCAVRHHKDVKSISMMGISIGNKTKHLIIFQDKTHIHVFN